jgi:hypothetical protein
MWTGELNVKVSHKKRIDQIKLRFAVNLTAANLLKQKLFWYAASVAVYGWFMFWIAYDFFVWHKPLTQGNVLNYIGVAASIALIWIEAQLFKTQRLKQKISTSPSEPRKQRQKRKHTKQQTDNPPNIQPAALTQTPQEQQTTQSSFFTCKYHESRQDSDWTPDECLTCTNLIQCRTTQSIKKQTTIN